MNIELIVFGLKSRFLLLLLIIINYSSNSFANNLSVEINSFEKSGITINKELNFFGNQYDCFKEEIWSQLKGITLKKKVSKYKQLYLAENIGNDITIFNHNSALNPSIINPQPMFMGTFDLDFELISGSIPTLDSDLNTNGENESIRVGNTGGNTQSSIIPPFGLWGGTGYLNTSWDASSGDNFFLVAGIDNCLWTGEFIDMKTGFTYELCFDGASLDPAQPLGTNLTTYLAIDIYNAATSRVAIIAHPDDSLTTQGIYSIHGKTQADYLAGTGNYWIKDNNMVVSTTTNDTSNINWARICATYTATSDSESMYISKMGGANFFALDNITSCVLPQVTAFALQPSCTDGTSNNDGYFQISAVDTATHYNWSGGSTYTGPMDIASAVAFNSATDLPIQFNTGLGNDDAGIYTIRVFNGADACFTDVVITLNGQDCTIGCDCDEYLYLNDIETGEVHKFKVNSTDGTLMEIGNPWMSGFDDPHGLGVDINGNFYIGDKNAGPIYKVSCDGGTVSMDATIWSSLIAWDLYNIGNYGGYILANGGGNGGLDQNEIHVLNPCDGTLVGSICLNGFDVNTSDWGLQVLSDGTILATAGAFGTNNNSIYQFQFDASLIDDTCVNPFVGPSDPLFLNGSLTINGTTYTNENITLSLFGSIYGITKDEEHLYVLMNETNFGKAYLLKINATTGALVAATDETTNPAASGIGWGGALGLVYASSSDRLYVSGYDDCISVLNPADLSYIAAGAGPVLPGSTPKAIAIVTECCPTNNVVTIDTTLCSASINDIINLQDLVNCNGTICEGLWQEGGGNTGLTYNSCDNTITIDALNACGTFVLESDGTGYNPQCGAFKITVNITLNTLDLTIRNNSCTDNNDGIFTTNYDVVVDWNSQPCEAGEMINVTHNGISIGIIDPNTDSSPSTFSLNISADGNGTNVISAAFTTAGCADSLSFKTPLPCPNEVPTCIATAGCLAGNAFEDFNCNGVDDTNELGVQGVQVIVYDCENNAIDTVWTDRDGDWQLCGLTDGAAYRVEFILPESIACWARPTHAGSDNGTNIQFLTAPACTKFSLSNPDDFCEENPYLIVPCYTNGDYFKDGGIFHPGFNDVLVGFQYNNSGKPSDGGYIAPDHLAKGGTIGNVWGLAYDKSAQDLYAAAFLKRHSGFPTSDSLGVIWKIDDPMGTPASSPFIDLVALGENVGQNLMPEDRMLGEFTGNPSQDSLAFGLIGRVGLGDLDISDDFQYLYVVNLYTKEVLEIAVNSGTITNRYPVPDMGCMNGETRPFALKYHQGAIYVGAVCSGENGGTITDLEATIYRFSNGSFNQIFNFPLDYDRDPISGAGAPGDWNPWTNTWIWGTSGTTIAYPQPVLSDIEFDADGAMILGFMDRTGHQIGVNNYDPGQNGFFSVSSGGDILRVCNLNGTYVLEGEAGCVYNISPLPDRGIGGEYYHGEEQAAGSHFETFLGGIALSPSHNQVIISGYSPLDLNTGGIFWLDNTTGADSQRYELYNNSDIPGNFGKAAGLGDVELICTAIAPLEIGNYVWCDSIENGIQDACERGIDSLIVRLYDADNRLVGQDTTINGNYYFNQFNVDTTGITVDINGVAMPNANWSGLQSSADYHIVFGYGQYDMVEETFTVGTTTYDGFTTANEGSNDNIDSDVEGATYLLAVGSKPRLFPVISMTTSPTGCGDHKYDLGILCVQEFCEIPLIYENCGCDSTDCNITIQQVYANTVNCTGGTSGTIDMNVIVNYVNAPAGAIAINGTNFTPNNTSGLDTFLLTGIPCLDKDSMAIVAQFVNNMYCRDSINTGLEVVNPRFDDLGWDCEDNSGNQTFADWMGTGVAVTISYSDNMYDGVPNIYEVNCPNGNDDSHCLTQYHGALRYTNNRNSVPEQPKGTATGPSFVKYTFDQPVFIDDFFIGSLSVLAANTSEWVHISAYDTTGQITFPTHYSTGAENCRNEGDLIPINVIPGEDCSIYAAGVSDGTNGGDKIYGHLKLAYSNTPVDSIIVEFWGSSNNYTDPNGAHSTSACSATINASVFEPSICDCCPEILALVGTQEICSGGLVDTLGVVTTFESPDSIAFVYFNTPQTDASLIYTGGSGIDTVKVTNGNDSVRIFNIADFTNMGIQPDTFFIYAIAHPTPNEISCRPFQEISVIVNACDWGDLPDLTNGTAINDYQTLEVNNGPIHIIDPSITLGNVVDGEPNGQPSTDALDDGIDEDGLTIFESLDIGPESTIRLPLNYSNTSGMPVHIEAWIDWNANGEFDVGEMVFNVTDPTAGLYDRLEVAVPPGAVTGEYLGLRIRISNHDDMTPYGLIDGGEIEDYLIGIACPVQICLPIEITIKK